jgi:hypothetical protein
MHPPTHSLAEGARLDRGCGAGESTMRPSEFAYKQDHPFDKRSAEAARIREK